VAKLAENIMLVIEGLVKHDARKVRPSLARSNPLLWGVLRFGQATLSCVNLHHPDIDVVVLGCAQQGKNIQALHIKTDSSIALPIYNSVVTGEDISYVSTQTMSI
jgi:hypothetical protein